MSKRRRSKLESSSANCADRPQVRCAIYTRKSSEEGLDQEYNSLDAQRDSAEAFIASQKNEGWVALPDRYDDGGYSGGTIERPAIERLLADVKNGELDCVVVYKVDRLSRSLLDFARVMETFEQHGVSFVSVTQQFNTTHSMGRLTLNILLSFAQFEREIIGERIRDKIAAQRRKGKWAGGVPVLGYDVDRSRPSPRLVVNAFEATRVRAIFDLYLEKGSLLPTVRELGQRGWTNKRRTTKHGKEVGGRPFDRTTLYALLINPIYVGKIRHKTEFYDGEHEAIVDPGIFKKVREALQLNGRTGGTKVRNKYGATLRGLLRCKACDRAMSHNFTSSRGKGGIKYRYHTCCRAIKSGRSSCPSGSIPAAEIEQVVVDQIQCIARDPSLQTQVLSEGRAVTQRQIDGVKTDRDQFSKQISRDNAEVSKLVAAGSAASATTDQIARLHERTGVPACRPGLMEHQKHRNQPGSEHRFGLRSKRRKCCIDKCPTLWTTPAAMPIVTDASSPIWRARHTRAS